MLGITGLVDRRERELDAAATARPRDPATYAAVLERAANARRADPKVADALELPDLYYQLAMEYQTLGRHEDALVAADEAVDAGLRSSPDPRCLRAEILMILFRVVLIPAVVEDAHLVGDVERRGDGVADER